MPLPEHAKRNDRSISVTWEEVFRILKTPKFVEDVPRFLNARQTRENVSIVIAAMLLLRQNYLTGTEISHGLNAFILVCRERNTEMMRLEYEIVQTALRIVGRAMSRQIFDKWMVRMQGFLECQQPEFMVVQNLIISAKGEYEKKHGIELLFDQRVVEEQERQKRGDKTPDPAGRGGRRRGTSLNQSQSPERGGHQENDEDAPARHKPKTYIYAHEFLYLMCNSRRRADILKKKHQIDFSCKWGPISHWEIFDEKTREYYQSKIPAIGMADLKNRAPELILQEALDLEVQERPIRFEGREKKQKGDRENQEFTEVYEEQRDRMINTMKRHQKAGQWFDITSDDEGKLHIRNFLENYVDKQKYDYKTIIELRREEEAAGGATIGGGDGDKAKRKMLPYDPNKFKVDENTYDFTLAPGYQEEIVRHNLNKVKRPKTAVIKAPALSKEIIIHAKPNYVEQNKSGLRQVHSLNKKRMQYLHISEQQKDVTKPSVMSISVDKVHSSQRSNKHISARLQRRQKSSVSAKRAAKMSPPDSPAYYSHTDVKQTTKRLNDARGVKHQRLFDGAIREIDYVNQTTRGYEVHDLNKQSKELKFNLSKSNILGMQIMYDNNQRVYGGEDVGASTNAGDVSAIMQMQRDDSQFHLGRTRPTTLVKGSTQPSNLGVAGIVTGMQRPQSTILRTRVVPDLKNENPFYNEPQSEERNQQTLQPGAVADNERKGGQLQMVNSQIIHPTLGPMNASSTGFGGVSDNKGIGHGSMINLRNELVRKTSGASKNAYSQYLIVTPMKPKDSMPLMAKAGTSDVSPDRDATTFAGEGVSMNNVTTIIRDGASTTTPTNMRNLRTMTQSARQALRQPNMSCNSAAKLHGAPSSLVAGNPMRPQTASYYKKIAEIQKSAAHFATNKALKDHEKREKLKQSDKRRALTSYASARQKLFQQNRASTISSYLLVK